MSNETTPVEGDIAVPADAPVEDATAEVTETPADEAPVAETPAEDAPADEAPADIPAGGVLDNVQRKPDASPSALHQLLLEGEKITHGLLDEIEKRCDVGDVKYLVAFCRHLLDSGAE